MMRRVFIFGINGNMGRRYRTILEHVLKVEVQGYDVSHGSYSRQQATQCDGIIIATPTNSHMNMLRTVLPWGLPVMCEKPLSKNIEHLEYFETENRPYVSQIYMVNQYEFLASNETNGDTFYDYWNTGEDGLLWDCINIIGLSRNDPVYIDNKSPIWSCMINGKKLNISDMDLAYIAMLRKWVNEPSSNYAYARDAHFKVARLEAKANA